MNDALVNLSSNIKAFYPFLLITFTIWATYCYVVFRGGFVSDDLAGLVFYNGLLQTRSSELVNLNKLNLPQEEVNRLVEELNKRPLLTRLLDSEYGMISRWLRYQLCGGNKPSKKRVKLPDGKEGEAIPLGKIPWRHHVLIIFVFNVATLLVYNFLAHYLGVKLALLACLLFVVHPVATQAVAWCSALGYPLSLLWIGMLLNLALFHSRHTSGNWTVLITVAFVICQFLGIHAQVIPALTCMILFLLGYWQWGLLGLAISGCMYFDIVKQTIDFRTEEFKKQQMGHSTKMGPKKLIVATKSFLYYLIFTLWPVKIGLYHKWGFHYGPELEKIDKRFVAGFLTLAGLATWFFLTPILPIKLAILWFSCFIFIFLNWVTIQQFVTERYVFIPSLGICLVLAYYTQNYPLIYGVILGGYFVRTLCHLPTYDNELRFYQSNYWNFPDSEVALGNLGVTNINMGLEGTAMDCWMIASKINPDYDVPWYNLFSTVRAKANLMIQSGDYDGGLRKLAEAYPYLEKTLQCKVCHFPDMWKKEQDSLLAALKNPIGILFGELQRLNQLAITLQAMLVPGLDQKRIGEIQSSIDDNNRQIDNLRNYLSNKGISEPQPLINWSIPHGNYTSTAF